MTDLESVLRPLNPYHREILEWFQNNSGGKFTLNQLINEEYSLVSRTNTVYTPRGEKYGVSVRVETDSIPSHLELTTNNDGTWTYACRPKSGPGAKYWWEAADEGMARCALDRVPIGVLQQVKPLIPKTYLVLGLALVSGSPAGYIKLAGFSPSGILADGKPANGQPVMEPNHNDGYAASERSGESSGRRYWALLANPDVYEIERALEQLEEDWWTTKGKPLRTGDRVLIWKSLGRTRHRGLVALGEVLTDPTEIRPSSVEFWHNIEEIKNESRVRIRYTIPSGAPYWLTADASSVLWNLSVANANEESVFSVPLHAWEQLLGLIGGWPVNQGDAALPAHNTPAGLVGELKSTVIRSHERPNSEEIPHDISEAHSTFDPNSLKDSRTTSKRAINLRRGQSGFRHRLLDAYSSRCTVSGCTAVAALEAAHIVPYRGDHTNTLNNGLLLRSDIHTLYDLGLIAIDERSLEVLIAQELEGTEYERFRGNQIHLPAQRANWPLPEALRIHRERSRVDGQDQTLC